MADPRPTMASIVAEAAAQAGLSVEALRSPARRRPVAQARQQAMARMREVGFTTTQVGRFFGRDHTTVTHACKMVAQRSAA